MDTSATLKAIKYALNRNWKMAIEENLNILKHTPDDIDALNRLAKAYMESGMVKRACQTANKVIKIDPNNTIAQKCLLKWKMIHEGEIDPDTDPKLTTESFLEDPGKTKIVSLINPGDKNSINKLDSGDVVYILTHSHKVSVVNSDRKYIGRLPDDLSLKIRALTKLGFEYLTLVKSVSDREVAVFIREIKKPKDNDTISFPIDKFDYISYTSPELVKRDELDMGIGEEI